MILSELIDDAAARGPDRTAFVQPDGSILTYARCRDIAHDIAGALSVALPEPGANVAVYSPNDTRAFLAILGIVRAGHVWVPLNARNTAEDNARLLDATDSVAIFYHSEFEEAVRVFAGLTDKLTRFICLDRDGALGPSLDDFTKAAPAAPEPRREPSRACNILATGGTTGHAKGAVWTNAAWSALIGSTWTHAAGAPEPVHLCVAPMTHAAGVLGLMLMPQLATNVVLTQTDPAAILAAIERHGVTHIFLPPTLLYALLASPELGRWNTSSLKLFLVTAAPVSPDKLKEAVAAFGSVLCQTFGQAEAPFVLFLSQTDHETAVVDPAKSALLKSCGRPTTSTRVEIMDEDGALLDDGQVGELVISGPLVTPGYYNDPQASAAARTGEWHRTGDIGYRDEEGYFFIVDRKRDMIITGGFNVYSSEVEKTILSHPAVQDCAVVGTPDAHWGEAVTAVVELKPGHALTPADLIAHCRPLLGGVKTPKVVEIWPTLPRTPVGKILKRAVRDHFWTGQDRAI